MLSDFALLYLFAEGSTIAGTITTGTADFLCAFGHCVGEKLSRGGDRTPAGDFGLVAM